jgi:hypothetical protein
LKALQAKKSHVFIAAISGLLLIIGFGALYLEFKSLGLAFLV